MLTAILLVAVFVLIIGCTISAFVQSLKHEGKIYKSVWRLLIDVFDAISGLG